MYSRPLQSSVTVPSKLVEERLRDLGLRGVEAPRDDHDPGRFPKSIASMCSPSTWRNVRDRMRVRPPVFRNVIRLCRVSCKYS